MRKNIVIILVALLVTINLKAQTATDGDYRSAASGDWNTAATWQVRSGGTWAAASVAPTATNNVYIQSSHAITVNSVDAVCNDLHLCVTTTIASISVATGLKVSVNGKIRSYTSTGSPFTTLGADGSFYTQTSNGSTATNITTAGTGKIIFVGNTRNITNSGEWSANPASWNTEFALNAGQTGTVGTAFKAGNITVSSGTITTTGDVRPDGNATGAGNLTILSGATLNVGGNIQRVSTASATSHFNTLDVQSGGTLNFTGSATSIGASVINFNGTIGYTKAAGQTLASKGSNSGGVDPYTYNNLNCTGSGTRTFPTNNINITVNGTLTLNAGNFLVGNGVASNTNTLTMGNSATIYRVAGSLNANSSVSNPIVRMGSTSSDVVNITIAGTGLTSTGELTGATQVGPGKVDLVIPTGITYTIQNSNKLVRNLDLTGTLNETGGFNITATGTTTIKETTTLGASLISQGTVQFDNVNNKTLTIGTGYTLTLASSSTNTARIADITNNGVNTGNTIIGNLTQQRFVPAKSARGWSFIASPVSQALNAAWQQQIHITGPGTGGRVCGDPAGFLAHTNGFDATVSNTPSIYTYDASQASGYRWVANTTGTTSFILTPGTGYRLNVRGGRFGSDTCGLLDGTILATTDTTLSATGAMTNGINLGTVATTYTGVGSNNYVLIGNPYPSQISFSALQAANTVNIANTYAIYRPQNTAGNYGYWDGSNSFTGAGNTGLDNTSGNVIANGQAIFVQTTGAVTTDLTLNFTENQKTSNANNGYFRTTKYNEILRIGYENAGNKLDEIIVRYSKDKDVDNNTIGVNEAISMNSGAQYLTSLKATKGMAIQTRSLITLSKTEKDIIALNVVSTQSGTYQLKFSEYENFIGYDIYLVDNYINSRTNIQQQNSYEFTVDKSNIATFGKSRFSIEITKSLVPSLATISAIKVYPNPVTNKQLTIELPQSEGLYTLRLSDATGKVVSEQQVQGGQHVIKMGKTGTGTYILEIIDSKGKRQSQKVVAF